MSLTVVWLLLNTVWCCTHNIVRSGEVVPQVVPESEADKPPEYRLAAERFRYEMRVLQQCAELDLVVYELKFPSAVRSPYETNNTVYAYYYRPHRCDRERVPAVIVLVGSPGTELEFAL